MNFPPKVSIVGTGHCGCAMAAELAQRGGMSLLYASPKHSRHLDAIREKGVLRAEMKVSGTSKPELTTDLIQAVKFSNYLVVTVPSYGHDDILDRLQKFDLHDHTIIFINGNFIAVKARKLLNARAVLETNASPFASRMEDGIVAVSGIKSAVPIAALPKIYDPEVLASIASIFPGELQWCENILEIGMQSNNGVIHPPATLLNTGWIETTHGDFYFYRDGMSPSVSNIIEMLDKERLMIAAAFGFTVKTVLEEMVDFYGVTFENFTEFASQSKPHNVLRVAPNSMTSRFVIEDIPFILVPWYELGLKAGIEAKTIKLMIDLASIINGVDYQSDGRSLKNLGLEDMSKSEILEFCSSRAAISSSQLQLTQHFEPMNT